MHFLKLYFDSMNWQKKKNGTTTGINFLFDESNNIDIRLDAFNYFQSSFVIQVNKLTAITSYFILAHEKLELKGSKINLEE